jgi:UBA-like domain
MVVEEVAAAASAASATTEGDDLLAQFRVLTRVGHIDDGTAKFFLEMCEGDVQRAAAIYKEQNPEAPKASGNTKTSRNSCNNSLAHSSHSEGTIGSRRRTAVNNSIRHRIIDTGVIPSNGSLGEPGGGLVTRHGRGFANNVVAIASAAEFEYLGGPRGQEMCDNSLNIHSDVFAFSIPGAFNQYPDGDDGYCAERRDPVTMQHMSAPARMNHSTQRRPNDRRVTTQGIRQRNTPPAGRRKSSRSPQRCASDPSPSHAKNHPDLPSNGVVVDDGKYTSPKRRRNAIMMASEGLNLLYLDDKDDDEHEGDDRMAVSSQSHLQRRRDCHDGIANRKPPPDTRYDGPLQNSWTGKSLRRSSGRRGSVTTTISALSGSQLDWSENSFAISDGSEGHADFHHEAYDEDDYAHGHDRDLDIGDIVGQSHNSQRGDAASNMLTELSIHEEALVGYLGSSSTSSQVMQPTPESAAARKRDPPGDQFKTTWLHEEDSDDSSSRRRPKLGSDDGDAKKPAFRPSRSTQHDRVKHAPVTRPDTINSGLESNEPSSTGANVEVQPQDTTQNCEVDTKLATKLGAVRVGVLADQYVGETPRTRLGPGGVGGVLDELFRNEGVDQHRKESTILLSPTSRLLPRRAKSAENPMSPSAFPLPRLRCGRITSTSATMPRTAGLSSSLGPRRTKSAELPPSVAFRLRYGRVTRVTRPGAAGVSPKLGVRRITSAESKSSSSSAHRLRYDKVTFTSATMPESVGLPVGVPPVCDPHASDKMNPGDSSASSLPGPGDKVLLAPATKPGAASVEAGNVCEPSERSVAVTSKGVGKGVRSAPATVPGAVHVVPVEPPGDSSTSCSLNAREQEERHSPLQILAPSGKVRHQKKASRPGAMRVSGSDDSGSRNPTANASRLRQASEPGAVSTIGDEKSPTGAMAKTRRLNHGTVNPGAVHVSGASEHDCAVKCKTTKSRRAAAPEVVCTGKASSAFADETRPQNCIADRCTPSCLEESSEGLAVDCDDCDDAKCDDPTLEGTTEDEYQLQGLSQPPQSPHGNMIPLLKLSRLPIGATLGQPNRMVPPDTYTPPKIPFPIPDKHRHSNLPTNGRILGFFRRRSKDKGAKHDDLGLDESKRTSKHKTVVHDEIGSDEDSCGLSRVGTSRLFPNR